MKTICFIETDVDGNVEWSEGCVASDPKHFEHSKELVDKAETEKIIKELQDRISEMGWILNPDRMGA